MTDKPLKEEDKLPESEAQERFDRAIKNALATPPKPHKAKPHDHEGAPKKPHPDGD